ncbi:tRNA glutamyl-Q(34) synthetase GluQRS [Pseudooceanicola algae]|uniref:Glutamate--tRNA ligase n=1 Tax=Pseudooceanicola algae TaxID=1537215 RepID=A0A418SE32_9RHOB|nr:tRNA glutamyl-Q(34) synthetase GluQRS [Pseudooceanicola algae]QPM89522.1 Glutamate--tRNA ligase [Pseudooceanicola algae]
MRTRFAPSPTGPLHLGHAYSALFAADLAARNGGDFLLRIEDIDRSRARPEWEAQIYDDLHWLGLDWPQPVMRQSDRLPAYRDALQQLWDLGLLYPCTCNRRDIAAALEAPQEGGAPVLGPDGLVYPGTCRPAPAPDGAMPADVPLRLNTARALSAPLSFTETGAGPKGETGQIALPHARMLQGIGDVVLARRDMGTSYHLSVVVDDAAQGITDVVRGQDLFEATAIHVLLQSLLGLAQPRYHHHALIRDETGKRLAKRDDARAIAAYRAEGLSPAQVRAMVGL